MAQQMVRQGHLHAHSFNHILDEMFSVILNKHFVTHTFKASHPRVVHTKSLFSGCIDMCKIIDTLIVMYHTLNSPPRAVLMCLLPFQCLKRFLYSWHCAAWRYSSVLIAAQRRQDLAGIPSGPEHPLKIKVLALTIGRPPKLFLLQAFGWKYKLLY